MRSYVHINLQDAEAHGSRLFYLSLGTQEIFGVDIIYEPELSIGRTPELAVSGPYRYGGASREGRGGRAYDLHPDGRFLMIREGAPPIDGGEPVPEGRINVIVNWFEELAERAPVD